ncbi:MAG: hypothetical protein RML95_15220 [Anaerolineae bacterium]|nr:hypothetical protein [Anaerolineae bacterium]
MRSQVMSQVASEALSALSLSASLRCVARFIAEPWRTSLQTWNWLYSIAAAPQGDERLTNRLTEQSSSTGRLAVQADVAAKHTLSGYSAVAAPYRYPALFNNSRFNVMETRHRRRITT